MTTTNSPNLYEQLIEIFCCTKCKSDLEAANGALICFSCQKVFPVIDGIPRFVPEKYWSLEQESTDIIGKTKNYFGFEWDYFKDWGFIKDADIDVNDSRYHGGLVSHRMAAFDSKCRLTADDLKEGKIVLDAGCGNGRYTYEAASRGKAIIIGVDIGYGSVSSAKINNKEHKNVLIIQASLFNLPFKDNVIASCFSNGVLMHTGNAAKAFDEIARTIKNRGIFVAHVYHKLNPLWEFNDKLLRTLTTKMSIETNLKVAKALAFLGRIVSKVPKVFTVANHFLRIQPTLHHMYDWYAAPIATHHTYPEVAGWFKANNFDVIDTLPQVRQFLNRPWACNLKGKKNMPGTG